MRFRSKYSLVAGCTQAMLALLALGRGISKVMAATVVVITTPSSIPAGSPVVHFEGLYNSGFGGPRYPGPYIEAGMTLDQRDIFGFPDGVGGSLAAGSKGPFIFPEAVNIVAWTGAAQAQQVTLYSDSAGANAIGTFDIPIPNYNPQPFSLTFQGFRSDVPFLRMSLRIDSATYFLDDLTFASVPESGAGPILAGGIGLLVYLRRRLVRQ